MLTNSLPTLTLLVTATALSISPALAQTAPGSTSDPEDVRYPWAVEFGIGWDNSISGNINSSGIGRINNQPVVILKNTYEDVYGTGLHLKFGGGYFIDEISEIRATFTFQSLDADLTPMGDIGTSRLYGQYQDYQSFGLDVGFRIYAKGQDASLRPYAEATAGIAFIDETDVTLAAPSIGFTGTATDFYDRTAAFTLGGNAGVTWQVADQVEVFGQLGLRWVSGMSAVDGLEGTGLETINDNSARWTVPFVVGVRARF
jgi:hypothetical protein